MKKLSLLAALLLVVVTGCSISRPSNAQGDYPAAIMVDDAVYLLPAGPSPVEVDPDAIIGYTTSYTDTFPEKSGETNFNRELDMPYAKVQDGIAVLYENEWYICALQD